MNFLGVTFRSLGPIFQNFNQLFWHILIIRGILPLGDFLVRRTRNPLGVTSKSLEPILQNRQSQPKNWVILGYIWKEPWTPRSLETIFFSYWCSFFNQQYFTFWGPLRGIFFMVQIICHHAWRWRKRVKSKKKMFLQN